MKRIIRTNLDSLLTQDGDRRYKALIYVLKVTDNRVDWAYDVWDQLGENLRHQDSVGTWRIEAARWQSRSTSGLFTLNTA